MLSYCRDCQLSIRHNKVFFPERELGTFDLERLYLKPELELYPANDGRLSDQDVGCRCCPLEPSLYLSPHSLVQMMDDLSIIGLLDVSDVVTAASPDTVTDNPLEPEDGVHHSLPDTLHNAQQPEIPFFTSKCFVPGCISFLCIVSA